MVDATEVCTKDWTCSGLGCASPQPANSAASVSVTSNDLWKACIIFSLINRLSFIVMNSIAGTYAQRLPFLRVFQAVLNAVTIMDLVEAHWLDEHFLAVEQASEAGLTGLHAFALAIFACLWIVRLVFRWLFICCHIAFVI